uniref:DYW domain-containing protein n=1 Tax=Vitis vinifera TaxID=29760 RepID=F6HKB8_VITVI
MIRGYSRSDNPREAIVLYMSMIAKGIAPPNNFTFPFLLNSCARLSSLEPGHEVHSHIIKHGFESDLFVRNALIHLYSVFGNLNLARTLFDESLVRDLVSYNTMIKGYAEVNQPESALCLFGEMQNSDEVTLVAVLSACARLGAFDLGKRLYHQYIENGVFNQNTILTAAVMDMYAKCGSIDSALEIFRRVGKNMKTGFVFNSMIAGLAQHGLGETAITVFRELISTGLKPDEVTFVGVLCACGHSGLIEEGKKLFESMFNAYGIKPQMEHYGCMVDLLGRYGCLEEAYDLVQKMPFEANSVIWRALLSACRTHGNVKIGEIAGQKLLEMEAQHGARYVLLSNILADANQWEEARQVRKVMEDHGIRKPPGWSYIELGGAIHRFVASDKSHPQGKEIELMLKDMAMRLKSAGYVPNTAQVMFDIDEEEKESVVSYHSEKLALAFGLMYCSPTDTIRIVKNLRICADCHKAFKLVSEIYGREITVRDTMRFHHFRNGSCSCMDFW